MKPKILVIVTLLVLIPMLGFAQNLKSTGIGLRGSYYKMSNGATDITVLNHGEYTSAHVDGGGGWLYFYSRINPNLFIEFSLGAVGQVNEETSAFYETEADVNAMTPVLLGLRHELFSPNNQSGLRPYLSLGGGPYWITNVIVREGGLDEEVTVRTSQLRGGYLGGGFDFRLFDWLALNFDVKHHFIDFNKNHEMSGLDYGFGITIMWGSFRY